jgi:F5/8 type C domain-containing protein
MTDGQSSGWRGAWRAIVRGVAAPLRARALAEPPRPEVSRSWQRAGLARLSAARRAALRGDDVPALILYREATFALARALVSLSEPDAASTSSPSATLAQLEADPAKQRPVPAELARQRSLLLDTDPLAFDRLSPSAASEARLDLDVASRWLVSELRARLPRRAPWLPRWVVLAGATVGLGSLAAWLWAADPNLARQALVSASSSDFDTVPAAAVDGFRYGQLGFHSRLQSSPWLALDLGAPRVITRVQAYGRGDCCFDQSVPLALEVSDDGVEYRVLATRQRPFTQYEPWIVRPRERLVARFVRLHTRGKQMLVLSEVEVYGHAP